MAAEHPNENPMRDHLLARIAQSGPLTLAQFMQDALMHPKHGYYTTMPVFGAAGDFITAPEISQMFGELIGLCLAQNWLDQGCPAFVLAELGPGRGTLMKDILRATRSVPGFHAKMDLWLIEASPRLRDVQMAALAPHVPQYANNLHELPAKPMWLVANEFFDALPIRQFRRADAPHAGWYETLVVADDGALSFAAGPATEFAHLADRIPDVAPGGIVEVCDLGAAIMSDIAAHIATRGGAALIFDYGEQQSLGDTFQALRAHAAIDPLASPGQSDLTAHVDFSALRRAALAAAPRIGISALTPQGVVLEQLGITARAQALAQNMTGAALEHHIAAHRRLTHPEDMGRLFKTIALAAPGAPLPPGYASTFDDRTDFSG